MSPTCRRHVELSLEEMWEEQKKANWSGCLPFLGWVATACCTNTGADTSILAIKATTLRRLPRVKAAALRLWNKFQGGGAASATTKKGQKKPSKTKSIIAAVTRQKRPTKRQRVAPVTPPKRQKPRKRANSAVPSDPSSGGSSSSDSSSNSEDSDDSSATSDSDSSSRRLKKKKRRKQKRRGVVTPPKTSKTEAWMETMMRENRKTLKLALKARGNAISATGSPASKMTTARQLCLEAMPRIYIQLEAQGWTKDAIQNLQRRFCVGAMGSRHKSNVTVTNKMNQTLKSGDFSCGNDCSYAGCRNGVTVIAVTPLTQEMARADNLDYRAFKSATPGPRRMSEAVARGQKVPPPESLREVIKYLNNYIVWLKVLVGDECSNLLAVVRLRDCLDENEERLEPVLIEHLLLTILWRVHEDARQFFHKCEMWNRGEPLPKSNLTGMVTLLENELMVVKSITCPYDKFFKKKKEKEKEKGKGKGRDKAKPGDELKKREPQATVNPTIPALCIATMKKIKASHPSITTITEFAAQTGIPLRDLLVSTRKSGWEVLTNHLGSINHSVFSLPVFDHSLSTYCRRSMVICVCLSISRHKVE